MLYYDSNIQSPYPFGSRSEPDPSMTGFGFCEDVQKRDFLSTYFISKKWPQKEKIMLLISSSPPPLFFGVWEIMVSFVGLFKVWVSENSYNFFPLDIGGFLVVFPVDVGLSRWTHVKPCGYCFFLYLMTVRFFLYFYSLICGFKTCLLQHDISHIF